MAKLCEASHLHSRPLSLIPIRLSSFIFVQHHSSSFFFIDLQASLFVFLHAYEDVSPNMPARRPNIFIDSTLYRKQRCQKHALHYLKISCQIEYNTQYCQEEKVQELFVRVRRRYGGGTGGKADEVGSAGAITVGTDLGPDSGTDPGPRFWYLIWSRLWNQNGFKNGTNKGTVFPPTLGNRRSGYQAMPAKPLPLLVPFFGPKFFKTN